MRKLAVIFPSLAVLLPATPVIPPYYVPPSLPPVDGFWYNVKAGDWLDKIAKRNGLSSWKDIYYHEKNKAFRVKRPDPNKIFPGDQLWIPNRTTVTEFAQPVINEFYGRLIDYDNLSEKPHNLILPVEKSIVLHWNVEQAEHIRIKAMTIDGTISNVTLPENGKVSNMNKPDIDKVNVIPQKSTTFTLFALNRSGTTQYYRHVNALLYKRTTTFNDFSIDTGPDRMDLLEKRSVKPAVLIAFKPQADRFLSVDAGMRSSRNPEMLEFIETNIRLGKRNPLAIRKYESDEAVRLLLQMEGFGFIDDPHGRRDAYVDILFWGKDEKDTVRKDYETCPLKLNPINNKKECLLSSCGLVVRSLWLLLGARDQPEWGHILNPPYQPGEAFKCLQNFAAKCGALHPAKTENGFTREEFLRLKPSIGDAVFIWKGNWQHVFTLIGIEGNKFFSIDGGTTGCKRKDICCGIRRTERTLVEGEWARFSGEGRPIMALVKFDNLIDHFVAPMVVLVKNKANKPGIDPCPPDPLPNSGESMI